MPHGALVNRAARRLGHPASIPRAIMSRSPEALALCPAVISFRRRCHCPSFGCLLNRSRDCTRSRVPPLSRRRYADPPAGASFPCSWRALRARIDVCFAKRLGALAHIGVRDGAFISSHLRFQIFVSNNPSGTGPSAALKPRFAGLTLQASISDAKTAARSRIPLLKEHAAPRSLRVRVRAGSAATG